MFRFNNEKTIALGAENETINVIPESGVSVKIEYWTGAEYVEDESSPITTPKAIISGGTVVRITPTGGYFAICGKGVQRSLGV